MKATILVGFLLLCASFSLVVAQNPDDICGHWLSQSGEGKIKIFRNANYFYGSIEWMKFPLDEHGKPKVDAMNPNPKLRNRPRLGMLLLRSFEFDESAKEWVNGKIYDPKTGKTYNCKMSMTDKNSINIRGYVGISLIGRTEIWTRVE